MAMRHWGEIVTGGMHMSRWTRGSIVAALSTAGMTAVLALGSGLALADPEPPQPPPPPPSPVELDAAPPPAPPLPAPPPPPADLMAPPPPADPLAAPPPPPGDPLAPPAAVPVGGPAAGQNPQPFVGESPFPPPSFSPVNGSMVGVAKPIVINFPGRVGDAGAAEQAVHISSNPPVPGKFYWVTPTQLRWRPLSFWPAHAIVNIDAGGTKSSFRTGDALVATADDATHEMTVTRNGTVEKTIPMSMGMSAGGHQTPNGTYYVLDKKAKVVMDSSTYGVPVNSTWGYKVDVTDAVQFDNSGDYVHSAPWSIADQGKRNVSHGCINISPSNGKWFYDNFGSGDPIVVKNSTGKYAKNDGSNDWQM
jgi:lipoprotein-anchoring transpeptidase ErfK/SrfK